MGVRALPCCFRGCRTSHCRANLGDTPCVQSKGSSRLGSTDDEAPAPRERPGAWPTRHRRSSSMENGTDDRRRTPYVGPNGKRETGIYTRRGPTAPSCSRSAGATHRATRGGAGSRAASGPREPSFAEHAATGEGTRGGRPPPDVRRGGRRLVERRARANRARPPSSATLPTCCTCARFGRRRLTDISPADVAAYVATKRRGRPKGWTIKGHSPPCRASTTYAARHLGFTGINPATLLDRVERPHSSDQRPGASCRRTSWTSSWTPSRPTNRLAVRAGGRDRRAHGARCSG